MSRVRILFVFALFALGALPARAQTILRIEIQQLEFENSATMEFTGPTDIGRLDIDYEAGPVPMFLNLRGRLVGDVGPGYWLVRNLYLHGQPTTVPVEQVARRFPGFEIGMEDGVVEPALEFAMTIEPTPLIEAGYADWEAANPINQFLPFVPASLVISTAPTIDASHVAPTPDPDWFKPYDDASFSLVTHPGCSMPNLDLDKSGAGQANDDNGCVPASCANSLHWLMSQHPQIQFPGSLRDTFNKLSKMMGRTGPNGVAPKDAARAKLDFAEAYGLPIHVKYQSRYDSGDVQSTTGHSTAADQGAANTFPTRAWLQQEADRGEDIEVNVSWAYTDSGKTKWDGSHALVLTGMGETGGKPWIKMKHDNNQERSDPSDLKQEESNIIEVAGAMQLPGFPVKVQRGDGTYTDGTCYITSVISESFDSGVTPPGGSEGVGGYCDLIKRTIPPLGSIDLAWPDDEARCYNATVWALDRQTDPPTLRRDRSWNHNRGKTRTWVNEADYPVTVFVHNDDWNAIAPYPGFDVGVNVDQGPVSGLISPSNDDMYGGFSVAGRDGSTIGFNPQANATPFADIGPVRDGFALVMVPTILDALLGPTDWRLWTEIPVWNDYWAHLGVVIDVLAVAGPGNVVVQCPNNGFNAPVAVGAPGRFFVDLGPLAPAPAFEVLLSAGPGLSITIDSVGIPSLTNYYGTAAPPDVVVPRIFVRAVPNPFNPRTEVRWGVAKAGEVQVAVYDLRGRLVRTLFAGWQEAGPGQEIWDGADDQGMAVASGAYLVRVKSGEDVATTKVTLAR